MASQTLLEESFFQKIQPFLIVCQIFGCAPLNDRIYNPQTAVKKVKHLSQSILQVIWSLLILALIMISTYFQMDDFDSGLSFLTRVLYRLEYIFGIFNTAVIIYGSQFGKQHFLKLLTKLLKLEAELDELEDYNFLRIFLKKSIFSYSLFFIAVLVVDFYYNKVQFVPFLRSSTVYTIPNVISLLALTQYCGMLYCIQKKYQKINSCLLKLSRTYSLKNEEKLVKKPNFVSIVQSEVVKTKMVEMIEPLRKTHSSLSILNEELNEIFGILIISTLAASFTILSIQFYGLYKMFETDELEKFLFLYTILWIILHAGKVAIILYANNSLSKEKYKTGSVLFQLDLVGYRYAETQSAIDRFSMQLLHQHRTATAAGIINLDLTLLNTFVGALTTYLVILIQFDTNARAAANAHNKTH